MHSSNLETFQESLVLEDNSFPAFPDCYNWSLLYRAQHEDKLLHNKGAGLLFGFRRDIYRVCAGIQRRDLQL